MTRRSSMATALLGLALGCATTGDTISGEPAKPTAAQPEDKGDDGWAERTMIDLERLLQNAKRVELAFEIQSEGAVESHFEGTLQWTQAGELHLVAKGEFAGEPQELELRADAESLEVLVAGESRHAGPRPAALVEAVVLSLTRQGLLHNLALLSAGMPPEHAEGGIAEWITYVEPQLDPPEVFGATEARPLEFQIQVQGQHVGHATLWLGDDDLPIERRQTVVFPEGQMKVVERYTSVVVE
jgi:hypothetical protein